jgi:hypothetical protein
MDNIYLACVWHEYRWPKELTSGVMFFNGQRITIKEFNEVAKEFSRV